MSGDGFAIDFWNRSKLSVQRMNTIRVFQQKQQWWNCRRCKEKTAVYTWTLWWPLGSLLAWRIISDYLYVHGESAVQSVDINRYSNLLKELKGTCICRKPQTAILLSELSNFDIFSSALHQNSLSSGLNFRFLLAVPMQNNCISGMPSFLARFHGSKSTDGAGNNIMRSWWNVNHGNFTTL